MGWRADGVNALDALRRSFNRLNVWHKWHQDSADVDNDFFFVLGRVDRESVTHAGVVAAEVAMRQLMTQAEPIYVAFSPMTLRIVR